MMYENTYGLYTSSISPKECNESIKNPSQMDENKNNLHRITLQKSKITSFSTPAIPRVFKLRT